MAIGARDINEIKNYLANMDMNKKYMLGCLDEFYQVVKNIETWADETAIGNINKTHLNELNQYVKFLLEDDYTKLKNDIEQFINTQQQYNS